MASQAQPEPVATVPRPPWSAARRIAFRFCFLYFGLYCLTNQVLPGLFPIPKVDIADLSGTPPVRAVVFWTAAHVFRAKLPLVFTGSGSGDKTFDWVLSFCLLAIAAAGALVWTMLARNRQDHDGVYKWFYLFLRFAVGSEMLLYGMVKLFPMQMPFPFLMKLIEPFGNFSPMGVLWSSIGASPGYERFVGSAELLGGVLLFFPRTTTLGALVCLADSIEVFMLNMTYDVPVKLFSFHLILMTLFLLAPELRRIASFFLTDRPVPAPARVPLFRTPRANRIAVAAQIVFGALLVGLNAYGAAKNWYQYGGGAPKSPLYGIWTVEQFTRDGQVQPPLLTDKDRFRRIVFDRPNGVAVQRMDDSFGFFGGTVDTKAGTITVIRGNDRSVFRYERSGHDQLRLDGDMDGHKLRFQLKLMDHKKLELISRGFHWIQEYPYNR